MSSAVLFHKQLGDLVLLQPALARLARGSGQTVSVLTHPAFAPVLELFGENVRPAGAYGNFKADRYGDLYVFERGSRPAWKSWLVRARKKHLLLSKKEEKRWFHSLVFDQVVIDSAWKEYRAHYYWRHVPGEASDSYSRPRLTKPPVDWAGRYPDSGNGVLIHATSAWKRKCWTVKQWHESMKALHEAEVDSFVITSGPDAWEMEHAREIAAVLSAMPGKVTCLAGQTSLRELISLVDRSRLVLAVDGAVAHLAAALGIPSLVLFGPANPLHWHSSTDRNKVLSARDYSKEQRPPAESIPVRDVVALAKQLYFQESAK